MISTARSVGSPCERCIQVFQQFILKVQGSIQQISSYTQPVDNLIQNIKLRSRHAHVIHMLDMRGTLYRLEPIKGSERAASRIARSVAIVIGIALSMQSTAVGQGSIDPIQTVEVIADKQLTEKQEYCHNLITFKESSNNRHAVNGSHYGYYQGRSKALKGAPDDYQFYWYWSYVSHRYGITQYDEPNYCKALHHLRVKGWQ